MKAASLVLVLIGLAVVVSVAAAADEPDLVLEVWRVPKDAKPIETKNPNSYKDFEKRIRDLDGKAVLDLLGKKVSIRLQNQGPGIGKRYKLCTGADFTHAIMTGRFIAKAKMVFHLQPNAQECVVKTPEGAGRIGIFYPPVGYVALPNGESYWFLFDEKDGR